MITLLVAPDSPQWAELADAALGVIVPSQSEPQSSFKTQFGPSGVNFAQAYTAKYNAPPSPESAGGLTRNMAWPTCKPCSLARAENFVRP